MRSNPYDWNPYQDRINIILKDYIIPGKYVIDYPTSTKIIIDELKLRRELYNIEHRLYCTYSYNLYRVLELNCYLTASRLTSNLVEAIKNKHC